MAVRAAIPVAHMFEKFLSRFRGRSLCKSRTDELPAMIVRAANKNLFPCLCVRRRAIMAICELLDLTDRIREMILEKRPTSEIKKAARDEGMRFLRESAVERVFEGTTTLREINKVTFVE